jgi:hypothetical protein
MRGADLRINGSTGGMMVEDFFAAGVEGSTIEGRLGWTARGGGGIAAVAETGTGGAGTADATGEAREAAGMDAVRRGRATEGGRTVGVDLMDSAEGMAGGLAVGARMGADFATGKGKLGGEAGETTRGGVTVDPVLEGEKELPDGCTGVDA